ncbi:MAG: Crp/Fnr family transcriptional regulator [Polyangiales bacterium]
MGRSRRRRGSLPVVQEVGAAPDEVRCVIGQAAGCAEGRRCPFAPRSYAAGAVLCDEGSAAEHVWYVRHGTVALFREAGEDRGQGLPWVLRKPGSLIGEEALLQDEFTDTAVAVTASATCVGRRDDVRDWVARDGSRAACVVMELVIRARIDTVPRPSTTDGSAPRRVARWLVDESRGEYAPLLPRRVLAGILGMMPETLSRALGALVRAGTIVLARREVRIVDPAGLLAAAEGTTPPEP